MTEEQCRNFRIWFKTHVNAFREEDPVHQRSLDLKEEHTGRVGVAAERIAASLDLGENDRRLAAVIALFHDLGRFPQYRQYRTFRDPDSDDHAKLSLRELIRHRVLHRLEPAERILVGRGIIFHNRVRLPSHLDAHTLLHCRLIRDADKVDILRVMAAQYRLPTDMQNPVVTLGLEADCPVRDAMYRRLFEGRIMRYSEVNNANELKVLQMSWIFDINFRTTFEILRENDDLGAIVATLPDTPFRREAGRFIDAYIDDRLNDTRSPCRG